MRKWLSSAVVVYVCSLPQVFAQSGPANGDANAVTNGSFEQGLYSPDGLPDGWLFGSFNRSASRTWDDTESKTGNRSVKITSPQLDDASWIQTVQVNENRAYYLSGWLKTENVAYSPEGADVGANLSLLGGFTHSPALIGTHDWTRVGVLFNSGSSKEAAVAARLGFYGGTTTGTAWFDDVSLVPLVATDPHPRWKILVLIYQHTNFIYTDTSGMQHHVIASMTPAETIASARQATQFVEADIPALTDGNMRPRLTIRYPQGALTRLSPNAGGWWPSPGDTAEERDPAFDSVIVIWDPRTIDQSTGQPIWIGSAAGLTAPMGTGQTYTTLIIEAAYSYGHRNVFKHEWGHSILWFFDAIGTAPRPRVENHAEASDYVNCMTGLPYVWIDETDDNPIPNSIYNNESGFTHDYYSGLTARTTAPTQCLGITTEAWAFGGPVSNSAAPAELPTTQIVDDKVNFVVQSTSLDAAPVVSGPAGVMAINAILSNESAESISAPVDVVVRTLSNGNILLTATEGAGSIGSKQAVDAGTDRILTPGERVIVQFRIGLTTRTAFTFIVDVSGGVVSP